MLHLPFPKPSRAARRAGFTLLEILVVMVVILLLAGLFFGALYRAQNSALETATRGMITKLHVHIMDRYESYENRRMPLSVTSPYYAKVAGQVANLPQYKGLNTNSIQFRQAVRLEVIRDLIRMEMPDCWLDIVTDPIYQTTANAKTRPSAVANSYHAIYRRVCTQKKYNLTTYPQTDIYQGAETLYMILSVGMSTDSLLADQIAHMKTGDKDKDGFPEFHDGWNNPISWIRWPAGFISPLQARGAGSSNNPSAGSIALNSNSVRNSITLNANNNNTRNEYYDHDPLDPFQVDSKPADLGSKTPGRGERLVPLIYSPGQDQQTGILRHTDSAKLCDPYIFNSGSTDYDANSGDGTQFFSQSGGMSNLGVPGTGKDNPGAHRDNIHNHMLGVK